MSTAVEQYVERCRTAVVGRRYGKRPEQCAVAGCGRSGREHGAAKGFCAHHYEQQRSEQCTVAGCEQRVKSRGLCQLHYGRMYRGELAPAEPPEPHQAVAPVVFTDAERHEYVDAVRTGHAPQLPQVQLPQAPAAEQCTVAGYERSRRSGANGLCRLHYGRKYRTGSPEPPEHYQSCSAEGCSQAVAARGMCRQHYGMWYYQQHKPVRRTSKRPEFCIVEGCEESARDPHTGLGFCKYHYMRQYKAQHVPAASSRECSVEGCTRVHLAKGYCKLHYRRMYHTGSTAEPERVRATSPECSVEGCTRAYLAKGLCSLHYGRVRRNGTTERVRVAPPECIADGCDRQPVTRGLCSMHYARQMRTGTTELVARVLEPLECSVEGCGRDALTRGLCRMHYERLRRTGGTAGRNSKRPELCSVGGCTRSARERGAARGFCHKHYATRAGEGVSKVETRTSLIGTTRMVEDNGTVIYTRDDGIIVAPEELAGTTRVSRVSRAARDEGVMAG